MYITNNSEHNNNWHKSSKVHEVLDYFPKSHSYYLHSKVASFSVAAVKVVIASTLMVTNLSY